VPVVAIPTEPLRRLIGEAIDDERLGELLENLGCDVEGFAPVRRIRCPVCKTMVERGEKDLLLGACPECLTDAGDDPASFWEDLGLENAIRIDLLPVRPDLFDAGGLARALRGLLGMETGPARYELREGEHRVTVDPAMADPSSYRPFIACAAVRGVRLDDFAIRAIMKLQENLHWAVGRDRKFASIGVYDLSTVEGPFRYRPVGPEEIEFVPLASKNGAALSPRAILEENPKGIAYKRLLEGMKKYPLLEDSRGRVLSMPPIINSLETALRPETTDLFIDVTGIEERPVAKALSVVITSLAEIFPESRIETARIMRGKNESRTPDLSPSFFSFSPAEAARLIGIPLDADRAAALLEAMRHGVERKEKGLEVSVPAYRSDILHQVDLIEDVAIAHGYDQIPRTRIPSFTQGREREERRIAARAGQALLGLGFSEAMSLMLTSERELYEKVRAADPGDSVRVENPASQEQTVLRTSLLPGLLRLLGENRTAGVTHRIYECDDVVFLEEGKEEPVEQLSCAAVIQDREAGFAGVKSVVQALSRELGRSFRFEPSTDPVFLEGRGAVLLENGSVVGKVGEVHPEVLEGFSIDVPVALFEIGLWKTSGGWEE